MASPTCSTGDGSSTEGVSENSPRSWDAVVRDFALGLSVAGWGLGAAWSDRDLPVRATLVVLHGAVAWLFLRRAPAAREGSLRHVVEALPSAIWAGVVVRAAPAPWSLSAQVLFVVGGTLAVASLLFLGRSFAIFPARRALVGLGPYRLVRHPAYLGELTMVVAAALAVGPLWWVLVAGAGAAATAVLRLFAEERLLQEDPGWAGYTEVVRYRLVPGLW